jgi:hypothetical protein
MRRAWFGAIRLWISGSPQFAMNGSECKRGGELAFKGGGKDNTHKIGTPPEFRAILISMAKSVAKATA